MPDNSLIGKTIDNFRIERFLGQGGMAAVYEATDLRLQRQVAFKIMHAHLASQQSFRERFVNEAQAAASLDHPNIVRVNTFNKDTDDLYIVMEMIVGGNLRQYIKQLHEQGKFIDYPEAIEIVRQLAGALHYAHGRRMVHRDIKPDNIMLKPMQHEEGGLNYRAVITDFGLAKLTAAGEEDATAEQPIGTYPYMSPEQINAETVDGRTDIYALGIMLYELSVGRLPYNPKTIAEAARMHGRDPLPLPTELRRGFPVRLEEIIVKALEKDREERYATAALMAKDLTTMTQEKKASTVELSRSALFNYMDQYDTDVQTEVLDEPIAPEPPNPVPERKERDKDYDCLYVTNGEDGFIHRLVRERTTIGRAARQDVALESELVSREHAVLERKPNGKYYLLDISESNGIWSQTYKLRKDTPVILQPDSVFRIGDYWMQFLPRVESLDDTAPPATSPEEAALDAIQPSPEADVDLDFIDDPDYATDAGESISPVESASPIEETNVTFTPAGAPPPAVPGALPEPVPVDEDQYEARTLEEIDAAAVRAEAEQQRKLREIQEQVQQTQQFEQQMGDNIDGIDTQLLGIVPLYEMPRDEPPAVSPYQFGFDRLVVYHKNAPPYLILLEEVSYTIGRDPINDTVLNGRYVSAFHARLELDAGSYYITDLGSVNGVWFENERLSPNEPTRLSASKVMRIGEFWLTFEGRRDITIDARTQDSIDDEEVERDDRVDDSIDTAVMVRPLEAEMPYYSQPPLSNELREADRLVFYSEDHPLKIEPITKETMTIGRGSNQDIQLDGRRVSRQHLVLDIKRNGNLYLRDIGTDDLGTTNNSWVDDIKIVADTEVVWGRNEIVRLGNYWMKFEPGVKLIDPGTLQDDRGMIGKTIGNYRIDRFLGRSHVTSVYKATDLQLNRDVSLKILDPILAQDSGQRQRFLEEARILSRLDHPNIVKVMSYNRADNEVFMVTELVTGGNLRAVIENEIANDRFMDLRDAVDLVVQLANGLHFAHQQGLMHRDITPDSIVLKTSGVIGPLVKYTPILTDFAIARYARTEDLYDDEGNTSFAYISPEAANGERTDIRSDIYELGVVLFELLSGRTPYDPLSIAEAIRMHTRAPIPRVSERRPNIPLDLEAAVTKTLQKSPNDRYQTGIDLARALQRILPILGTDDADVASLSLEQDINNTQIMAEPLARHMPLLTHPPRPDGDAVHDRLVLYSEQYPTQIFDLNKPIFTIGRGDDQDILLESGNVSRRHARIERSPDNIYRVVDVGSINGSWMGSYKLIENVQEIWDIVETVRIADYWLRIENKDDLNGTFLPPIPEDMPEEFEEEEVIVAPIIKHPSPNHDKIQVTTNTTALTVQAGSTVTMSVEVVNLSDFVDHFEVRAVGLPPDWIAQPFQTLDLLPNNRETTSITFSPPLASTSSAGSHAFEVRVTAEAKGISAVRTQCSLTILPFYSYRTNLFPDRVRNKGKVELSIQNTSNAFSTFTVDARDRDQALKFNLEGKQYALPPGYTESVVIDVAPLSRPWFGREQNLSYEITASPVPIEQAGGAQIQRGDLTLYPRLRVWYFIPLLFLCICSAILLAIFAYTDGQRIIGEFTETAVVEATSEFADQTATAASDVDGDGLSFMLESTLMTFPELKDTDEDGLDDGEEVRIWNTDPLNRDTDNDTLSDGDEVNIYGTSPTLEDTDGDGILDPQDLFPNQASTPTVTPFPTLEGGDICANSPIPSRVAVGMTASVEPGGVANRVRSEASIGNGEIIAFMEPNATFQVIGGPTCDPDTQVRFWQVDYNGIQGWTAEGEGEEYYIAPPETEGDGTDTASDTPANANASTDAETGDNTATDSTASISNAPTTADLNADPSESTLAVANTLSSLPQPGAVSFSRNDIGIQMLANVDSNLMSSAVNGITPLNMGWVKLQASWEALQPNGPEVSSQLLTFQSHLNLLKSNGYNVLITIAKAPTWARATSIEDGPPDNLADLENFINTLLELSGSQINAIEVWNEPNLRREWNTEAYAFTGSGYMQLFDRAYNTIRAYSADITIVSAGLAPTGNSAVSVQDRQYLRQMYNAGLNKYQNVAIGTHPYGWGNSPNVICCDPTDGRDWDDQPQFFFLNTIATYHDIVSNYNHNADLWLTEFGWSTWNDLPYNPPEIWMSYLTTDEQTAYTFRAFEIGAALDYVGPMFLWNYNFANNFTLNNRDEMAGYSLVISDEDNNFKPRALYTALMGS
jgi:serine/threonine protein kinase